MRLAIVLAFALVLASPALASRRANVANGKILFKRYCGSCHTLKDAATVGKGASRGPVLTGKSVTVARVRAVMTGSSAGMMPAFLGTLTAAQVNDVVAYVVKASKPVKK